MKNQFVKVIVSGLPGSGKTTIANLIADHLTDRGFDIVIEADDEPVISRADCIAAILEKGIEVHVEERDAGRRPTQAPPLFRRPTNGTKTYKERRNRYEKNPKPKEEWFSGQDEEIQCSSCEDTFMFTVEEQRFFMDHDLDRVPRTCQPCRRQKRANRHAHS